MSLLSDISIKSRSCTPLPSSDNVLIKVESMDLIENKHTTKDDHKVVVSKETEFKPVSDYNKAMKG
jgi:hypothetical protein